MADDSEKSHKFPIRVDLDKEDAKMFENIQKKFKLKNKADVLRFCVNKVYHGVALEIDEDLNNEIHNIISSRQIKSRYGLIGMDDFIKRAISEFLTILRKEWSLKNWNMRQTLSQEENDTAVALLELQVQKIPGVTIEDLATHLREDEKIISTHIEKFMADSLLDFRESHGKIYYYAQ
ncbi:hypothetical protein CEE45_16375 [Candidatus Heimdallarchaeota archaeon B3_Heim]|nr:MAG: hypothetical protein CEE45_16375 [Candidatus Heimdallarchaeota archaeon B3_Heim]